jgi:hypothetical protein
MRPLLLVLLTCVAAGSANAALLFEDRHAVADGEETVYRFEAKSVSSASMVEQSKAIKSALVWAGQFYGVSGLTVAIAQERAMPVHHWLIAFTVPGHSKTGTYYSVVLPDGSVVEPKISRQGLTATANPMDVTKGTELEAPVKGPEIHGEIEFDFGWGKGLRCYGPYVPGPLWYGPAGH